MRDILRVALVPFLLAGAGCMGVTAQDYQRGDNSERSSDMDACMAEATREVPQRLDYAGIDNNGPIRMRYFDDCMAEKGYTTPERG